MRILVDEDLASRELIRRLEHSAHFVLAPIPGHADIGVWERAQVEHAAVLTGNVVDFLPFVAERPEHHGLLLVYRQNDPTRDLRAGQVAEAVTAIAARFPAGIRGVTLVVNSFAVATG